MHQHALHPEHDIVLEDPSSRPSVLPSCPMPVLCVNKWSYHIFDILVGHHSTFRASLLLETRSSADAEKPARQDVLYVNRVSAYLLPFSR